MKTMLKLAPVIGLTALLAACGTTTEQRAATGSGGAVAGQAIGGNTGATVAGGVIGAVAGAATTPKKPHE